MDRDLKMRGFKNQQNYLINKDGILANYCKQLDIFYCKRNLGKENFCLLDEKTNCEACKCLKSNKKLYS